jgi:hypothetical protein
MAVETQLGRGLIVYGRTTLRPLRLISAPPAWECNARWLHFATLRVLVSLPSWSEQGVRSWLMLARIVALVAAVLVSPCGPAQTWGSSSVTTRKTRPRRGCLTQLAIRSLTSVAVVVHGGEHHVYTAHPRDCGVRHEACADVRFLHKVAATQFEWRLP